MGDRFQKHFTKPSMRYASYDWTYADNFTLAGLVFLLSARLFAIFVTPLELYVDEAQYWVWSQDLSLGYYSKPPIIAWIIGISDSIIGHSSFSVRIFAPWSERVVCSEI